MVRIVLFLFVAFLFFTACNKPKKVTPQPIQEEEIIEVEEPDSINEPIFTEAEILKPLVQKSSGHDKYFLISASFSDMANAEKHQKTLLKQGLSSEIIIREEGTNSDFYKVSYMSFSNWSEAKQVLERERNTPGKEDVWLLVKK